MGNIGLMACCEEVPEHDTAPGRRGVPDDLRIARKPIGDAGGVESERLSTAGSGA